jgi:HK97 family phage portal protein
MSRKSRPSNSVRAKSTPPGVRLDAGWRDLQSLLGLGSSIHKRISEIEVLYQAAVTAAIDVISQDVAKATLRLVQVTRTGKKVLEPSQSIMARRLSLDPNGSMSWHEWIEMVVRSLALHQNAYIVLLRRNDGDADPDMVPVHYHRVTRNVFERRFFYDVCPKGSAEAAILGFSEVRRFSESDIIHLKGRMFAGDQGLSTLTIGADVFNLNKSLVEFQAGMAENGLRPNAVITTDEQLTDEQFARLKKEIREMMDKAIAQGKPALLDNGLKYSPIAMDAEKSDLVKARQLLRQEVASLFRVPGYKIGAGDQDSKYSNREHAEASYVDDCLSPVVIRVEQSLNREILTDAERLQGIRFEFDRDDLYDRNRQMASDRIIKQFDSGIITRGQAAAKLGWDPIEEQLDTYKVPVNAALQHRDGSIQFVTPNVQPADKATEGTPK